MEQLTTEYRCFFYIRMALQDDGCDRASARIVTAVAAGVRDAALEEQFSVLAIQETLTGSRRMEMPGCLSVLVLKKLHARDLLRLLPKGVFAPILGKVTRTQEK